MRTVYSLPAGILALGACCLLTLARVAHAGPPLMTDDPEPVELHHWEIYLGSALSHDATGTSGTAPHLEVNNGIAPNTQLHIILPYAVQQSPGGAAVRGVGDTELGVKYRFQQEGTSRPMLGIFPLLELPTGNAARGLGSGHLQLFLPVWAQKSWQAWTDYGGGGYWINPGAPNRNYVFLGNAVQRDLNARVTLSGEVFYTSASIVGRHDRVVLNAGGQYNFSEEHHLLFSVGHSIYGEQNAISYLAYQLTFGPSSPSDRLHLE